MSNDGLGPCDFTSVARHVATKLDKATPAALTFDDLAEGYHHANPADLSRVKRFCGLTSDAEAVRWLVEQAVDGLRPRNALCVDDGTVRLADGKRINSLTFQKRRVREVRDDHERLRDAFNPLSGEYSDNIRRTIGNLDDLRESMKEFGWIKDLPAIKDERDVVLVGHRRMAVAKELGIEPVVTTIRCGDGDEGQHADSGWQSHQTSVPNRSPRTARSQHCAGRARTITTPWRRLTMPSRSSLASIVLLTM